MTLKKLGTIVVSVIGLIVTFGGAISLADNYMNQTWVGIDVHFVTFCVMLIVVGLVSICSLVWIFFSNRALWLMIIIIPGALFIKFGQPDFTQYHHQLWPLSEGQFMKTMSTTTRSDESYVYVYRSDCFACENFTPRLKQYLKQTDNSVQMFNLVQAERKLGSRRYSALVKKLNLKSVPAFVYFGVKRENSKYPYTITFNNLADDDNFSQFKQFMTDQSFKPSSSVVYTSNN